MCPLKLQGRSSWRAARKKSRPGWWTCSRMRPGWSSAVPTIWGYFREQRFRAFSKGLGSSIPAHYVGTALADAQLVHLFERRAAPATNDGRAIAAHERVGHLDLAVGAIKRFVFGVFNFAHRHPSQCREIYTRSLVRPSLFFEIFGQDLSEELLKG